MYTEIVNLLNTTQDIIHFIQFAGEIFEHISYYSNTVSWFMK